MALRKRLFWTAKEPLLPCKTYAFGTQNNRFCKALIARQLHNRYACEKYLHLYRRFFAYIENKSHALFGAWLCCL
ncbi:hypothetical protein PI172_2438 [Prevotella intermedia]|uniref:Uncharacterized protein n=1 Tax=Prevotella intermedia TaxID=28131 RepID=A0AAD1BM54_PREIN|nr:hypothetical protein PIN17_0369 [Prevotella intermedia 17]BAR97166.1 hypothetical protein PI172_2438 [Prevotella intermedia]